jgi:hypothetical protein
LDAARSSLKTKELNDAPRVCFGMAVAHPSDREIHQHAGLYRQVRFAEVGYEKQILSKFRSLNVRAVRRIVDQRAGAND